MRIGQQILSFFLPAACLSCRGVLAYEEESPLCVSCRGELKRIRDSFCVICGDPFVQEEIASHACGKCLQDPPPFRWARSVFALNPCLSRLLHALKYRGRESALAWLAQEMAESLRALGEGGEWDLIVPVPLHTVRLLKRGYNQSHRLGQALQKILGLPLQGEGLVRQRYERPQTFKTREERIQEIRGAFEVRRPSLYRGKKVLLIDDVYTTGATLRECAAVLQKAEAEVFAFTVARTPLHFPSHSL